MKRVSKHSPTRLEFGDGVPVIAKDPFDLYVKLNKMCLSDKIDRHGASVGCRRVACGVVAHLGSWNMKSMPSLSEGWGYSKAKMTLLRKFYRDEDEVQRVANEIRKEAERSKYWTTRTLLLKGKVPKDTGSDHCMTCVHFLVVRETKKKLGIRIEVCYRTTEVSKKFAADLWFLDELFRDVLGDLLDQADYVVYRMHFHSCYGSTVFSPAFMIHAPASFQPTGKTWYTARQLVELARSIEGEYAKFMQRKRIQRFVRGRYNQSDVVRDRVQRILSGGRTRDHELDNEPSEDDLKI